VHNGSDAVLLVVRPQVAQVASATPAPAETDTQAN